MRIALVLTVAVLGLFAFGVACGDDDKGEPAIPAPASESEGEAGEWDQGWEAEEGAEEEGEGVSAEGDGEGVVGDGDGDGVPDGDDNCPETGNSDQEDFDGDLEGDACDDDDDNDGFGDFVEVHAGSDLFDDASVPESEDANPDSCSDGVDNDGDGLTDVDEPGCPGARPFFTEDSDGDGVPDVDDDDDDNDGFGDLVEFGASDPLDAASVPETDLINDGSCTDGVDNDGDGFIDFDDDGCM